jgi:hypothetical protein
MSPLDAGFRKRLAIIFQAWREAVASVLREGQTHGSVRRDVARTDAAGLLIAMVEGYSSLAKSAQDPKVMKAGIRNMVDWLRSLRPPGNRKLRLIASVSSNSVALLDTKRCVWFSFVQNGIGSHG